MPPVNDNVQDDFEIKEMPDGNLWLAWERREVPFYVPLGQPEHVLAKFAAYAASRDR